MVEYTTTPSDVEMGLEERTVVLVEKKSSTGRLWKVTGALLFVALCFGGVLLFVWYQNGRPEMLVRSSFDPKIVRNPVCKKGKCLCFRCLIHLFPVPHRTNPVTQRR